MFSFWPIMTGVLAFGLITVVWLYLLTERENLRLRAREQASDKIYEVVRTERDELIVEKGFLLNERKMLRANLAAMDERQRPIVD